MQAAQTVSLMTVAWVALKPQVFQRVVDGQELSEPNGKSVSDSLKGVVRYHTWPNARV